MTCEFGHNVVLRRDDDDGWPIEVREVACDDDWGVRHLRIVETRWNRESKTYEEVRTIATFVLVTDKWTTPDGKEWDRFYSRPN